MESNTVERVTEWDSEPFAGGHDGLRDLAEQEFTGAVTDGTSWLFMLNGRVLGVFDGDMSQFADADGTAYVAPDQSLPLLFAMQETGGEVRGEYYTEETPISEVDRTLQSGNFTGYVELSENVLSGDYYLVYYGGRLLPVAFVGNQRRRLSGDEAFDRAADEVGIYRVKTVDLNVSDVPEPDSASTTAAAATGTDELSTPTSTESAADSATESATESTTEPATEPATTPEPEPEPEPTTEPDPEPTTQPTEDAGSTADRSQSESAGSTTRTDSRQSSGPDGSPDRSATERAATAASAQSETDSEDDADPFEAESEWRGTTTIPALDPEQSVSMQTGAASAGATAAGATVEQETESSTEVDQSSEELEALQAERDRLQARVEELEAETKRLSDERNQLKRERDEATATAEELEAELEQLRATVDELESELDATEAELSAAQQYVPEGDHELEPEEAIAGTSLFVRYERKGGPTLEDAHNGDADRDAVNDNVRLEHHTEFDDEGAVVDGEPFVEWLRGTIEFGFVEWLTRTFIHDVRETRNQTAMGKLFDAIPDVDRIEFRGTVDLEDEEADAESASFDVVLRDRMGQPLVVTDLNDSREPATEPMLESLVRNATPVGESSERLAAAFYVTSSYYEPGALETAEEATGGGFLGRGKHKSFVKLSRKDGYHLCLVETRDGEFHVSVPEL